MYFNPPIIELPKTPNWFTYKGRLNVLQKMNTTYLIKCESTKKTFETSRQQNGTERPNLLKINRYLYSDINCKKMYSSFEPNNALKPYVASFFSLDFERGDKERIDEICLPFGCSIMGFQFKGRCKILIENQSITTNRFYTTGQQTFKYHMISDDPVLSIAGTAFQATGLWHLFRLNMPAMVMHEIDTRTLFKDHLCQFNIQFNKTESIAARVQLIEGLLMDSLKNATPNLDMIDIAVDMIHENQGCCQMKHIIAKLNVSQGYFEKKFKKMVGITPSAYSRIIRFSYLFSALEQKKKLDYKALSTLFNYYDLPHFSKDFKRFSGKSPSKFHLSQFKFINDYMVKNPLGVRVVYPI